MLNILFVYVLSLLWLCAPQMTHNVKLLGDYSLVESILPIRKAKHPLNRPWEFQETEVPIFQDSQHMKVARLSALRTGRLYSLLLEADSTPGP